MLAGRVRFSDPRHLGVPVTVLLVGSVLLAVSDSTLVVIFTQVAMACVLVVAGIYLSKVLHDEIPSSVRAGVASGVGAASSLVFLVCALCFGFVTDRFGVPAGGWIVVVLCVVTVVVLARVAMRRPVAVG
jgi:MFS family permease